MPRTLRALVLSLAFLYGAAAQAQAPAERTTEGVGLTIYSQNQEQPNPYRGYQQPQPGFGVVKVWKKMTLAAGKSTIRFPDVAATIDATSVSFSSLTDPAGTFVVEQNFEYDLVSADKLLSKFLDKVITLITDDRKEVTGRLLSFDGANLVLHVEGSGNPIQIIQRGEHIRDVHFPEIPGGLITKPALVWMLDTQKAGEHLVKLTYQAAAIRWNSDYTVVTNPSDTAVDVSGWVTIQNNTGTRFPEAEIKLVAGDVHRITTQQPRQQWGGVAGARRKGGEDAGFQEKEFFEYHLYTLGRPSTVENNSTKQIELFSPASGVPCKKILVYYGGLGAYPYGGSAYTDRNFGVQSNPKVDVYLQYKNSKDGGLGIPMPAGKVRVYKKDPADGSLEFVGEDAIDHTPKDEKVLLNLGSAFDVVGERKQTNFECGHDWCREAFEIKIRNHKKEEVEVIVKENLYRWSNWKVEQANHDFTKEDSRTIHIPVKVKPDGEEVITYTVFYSW